MGRESARGGREGGQGRAQDDVTCAAEDVLMS